MNFAKSKIKELYLRKLREDSDFAGRVKVRFYIESDGTTRDFEVVESTTADPAFDRELIEVLKRRLRFKDRYIHETIEIVYPFAFTSPDP